MRREESLKDARGFLGACEAEDSAFLIHDSPQVRLAGTSPRQLSGASYGWAEPVFHQEQLSGSQGLC